MTGRRGRFFLWTLSTGAAVPSFAGTAVADTPMSYLATAGAAADPVTRLAWGLGGISIAVSVIVGILLLGAILRRRSPPSSGRTLVVARKGAGLAWISIGVGISTVVLLASAVWSLTTLAGVLHPAQPATMRIRVTAHQWWWEARYLGDNGFVTANEIHIPVGTPVDFELASDDVIHSFWIPKLGGKMDVIPGQTNVTWLEADKPGTYRGQCGEYCGAQHAQMAMFMVADRPADFEAWQRDQRAPVSPSDGDGHRLFADHCGVCHTVRGVSASGTVGPDLTHLMSRHTIAAGILANRPDNLSRWIADPQSIKPGSLMPKVELSDDERARIVAYLQTLK